MLFDGFLDGFGSLRFLRFFGSIFLRLRRRFRTGQSRRGESESSGARFLFLCVLFLFGVLARRLLRGFRVDHAWGFGDRILVGILFGFLIARTALFAAVDASDFRWIFGWLLVG